MRINMRNCAIDGCPACKGRLDTKAPLYEESTDEDKINWGHCRREAYRIDFEASEEAYSVKSLDDLTEELNALQNDIERYERWIKESGYDAGHVDYKELFNDDMRTAIDVVSHVLERGKIMTTMQDVKRHIKMKNKGEDPKV